jgi:hypothetical protein
MKRSTISRWLRIGLVALALAGAAALPVVDHEASADGRTNGWCIRC